jgi:DNA-binding HxlR family transcriptional regulator
MELAQDPFRGLFWNKKEFLSETVPKLMQIMRIDEKGNIVQFLVPYNKLSDRQKIGLQLTARYVACEAKKVNSAELTTEELRSLTGIKRAVIGARLKEMFDSGFVEKNKKEGTRYSITPPGISRSVDDVLESMPAPREPQASLIESEKGKTFPAISDVKSVREAILKLLSSSIWIGKPKTLSEIREGFEINALYYPRGTVGTELKRMTKSGLIRRVRLKSGFGYVTTTSKAR